MTQQTSGKPLRVLVIPDKYLPDEFAGGAIYSDMCCGLASRGLDVTVRCPYPFYPEWKDKSGRNGLRIDRSVEGGVKVERYGFFIPRNPRSAAQRMLLDATFFASLTRSLFRGKFDAIIALCPHTGGVAFAALHKLIHGRPLCLSVMDLPADAAKATGITRHGWLQKLLHNVQKTLFNRADVWRSLSPAMIEKLNGLTERDQPILFIPDWLHPSLAEEIRRLPSKVGRQAARPPKLLYSGNIGTKQGLLDFCKAIAATPAPFEFRNQGSGGNA
ncbi:glycosyltransferase, partial [Singulisphaera rosea]